MLIVQTARFRHSRSRISCAQTPQEFSAAQVIAGFVRMLWSTHSLLLGIADPVGPFSSPSPKQNLSREI